MEFAAARRFGPWFCTSAFAALLSGCASTESGIVSGDTRNQVIISVRDQKLTVVQPDHHRVTFPISTSKYGFGDRRGSYTTPLGELAVAAKIGSGAPTGSVFKSRVRTGEIVGIDAPGRDAIVTRILALRGLESGNKDAWSRGIYIHGTPEERNIGRPSSYGCIRMRSRDVIALYDMVKVGARVQIIDTTVNKAIAANIVTPATPPAAPPVVAPAAATAIAANLAPNAGQADPATVKALSAAIAADRKTNTNAAPPTLVASSASLQAAAAPKPATPAAAKSEWAGSPTRLLAKANESEAKTKNLKSTGATRANTGNQGRTTETSYNTGNSRDINHSVLDSL